MSPPVRFMFYFGWLVWDYLMGCSSGTSGAVGGGFALGSRGQGRLRGPVPFPLPPGPADDPPYDPVGSFPGPKIPHLYKRGLESKDPRGTFRPKFL